MNPLDSKPPISMQQPNQNIPQVPRLENYFLKMIVSKSDIHFSCFWYCGGGYSETSRAIPFLLSIVSYNFDATITYNPYTINIYNCFGLKFQRKWEMWCIYFLLFYKFKIDVIILCNDPMYRICFKRLTFYKLSLQIFFFFFSTGLSNIKILSTTRLQDLLR